MHANELVSANEFNVRLMQLEKNYSKTHNQHLVWTRMMGKYRATEQSTEHRFETFLCFFLSGFG